MLNVETILGSDDHLDLIIFSLCLFHRQVARLTTSGAFDSHILASIHSITYAYEARIPSEYANAYRQNSLFDAIRNDLAT